MRLFTNTLLSGILAFFLLGVITYFTYVALNLMLEACLSTPSFIVKWSSLKKNSHRSYFQTLKETTEAPIGVDIACAITITVTGVFYCLLSYVLLDGVIRLLPLLAFLFGVYLLNLALGAKLKVVNKYLRILLLSLTGYPFYIGIIVSRASFIAFNKFYEVISKRGIKKKNSQ